MSLADEGDVRDLMTTTEAVGFVGSMRAGAVGSTGVGGGTTTVGGIGGVVMGGVGGAVTGGVGWGGAGATTDGGVGGAVTGGVGGAVGGLTAGGGFREAPQSIQNPLAFVICPQEGHFTISVPDIRRSSYSAFVLETYYIPYILLRRFLQAERSVSAPKGLWMVN